MLGVHLVTYLFSTASCDRPIVDRCSVDCWYTQALYLQKLRQFVLFSGKPMYSVHQLPLDSMV
jgi:hypothetical protein